MLMFGGNDVMDIIYDHVSWNASLNFELVNSHLKMQPEITAIKAYEFEV